MILPSSLFKVSNIYDRYILLLKHYLEARHGFTLGRTHLATVLSNLAELETLTNNYGHIILTVDPSKVDPLILEVFNLSQNVSTQDPAEARNKGEKSSEPTKVASHDSSPLLGVSNFQRPPSPLSSKTRCTAEAC